MEINHKDEDKTNNRLDNLEYCTKEYNSNYGTRGERISKAQEKPVESIDMFGRVKRYPSLREAAIEEHVLRQDISHCVRGKRHTCGGFAWRYSAEIEHYGLGDCQKVVCADSARTTGEVKE